MSERKWEQLGAAAGVIAMAFVLGSLVIVPAPPHIDASTAKIARFIDDNRSAVLAGQAMGVIGAMFFLWFVSHMRHVLARAEAGAEAWSSVVTVSGTMLAAVIVLGSLPMMLLGFMSGQAEGLTDASIVRMLWDMTWATGGVFGVASALFLASMGMAMVRKELVAPWLGWASLGIAAINVCAGTAWMTNTSYSAFWTFTGFVGFVAFAIVILIASAWMVRAPEADRGTVPGPVFAH
jgi:hypothetical protein